ncbi:MAG: MATE family efflux transporter [Candidatus Thermoplasmatota archaeon]|nr:MATE family efflux transporter [Candidatus Thermoplasmatota archaeon]
MDISKRAIIEKYHHVKNIFVKSAEDQREEILSGPIVKTLLILALPVMVSSAMHTAYNIADTFWLGKLGSAEVGAPTAAWPVIFTFLAIGMGFSTAGVSLISQHTGAGGTEKANEAAGQVFGFILIIGVATGVIGFLAAPLILKLVGTPPDVFPLATSYLRIVLLSMPFIFVYISFRFLLRGIGDMVTPMLIRGFLVVLNMILDPILIFGIPNIFGSGYSIPPLGVTGAAIATAVARTLAAIVGIYLLFNDRVDINLSLKDLKLKFRWIKQIVKIGAPATLARAGSAVGFIFLFALVAIFGEKAVAAYGIGRRVIHVVTFAIWGFAAASMTMVGQNVGAEQTKRAENIVKKAIIVALVIMFTVSAVLVIFREPVMRFFINDQPVIDEGARYIAIFALTIPFFGVYRIFDSTFRGTGHTVPAMGLSLFRIWGTRILLSATLALSTLSLGIITLDIGLGLGVVGIWYGMAASNLLIAGLSYLYFFSGRWKKKTIKTE